MKSKLLLSLAVALVFPFLLASCGGHKEPKDMTNQELIETYKKEVDKTIEEIGKCTTIDEAREVEEARNTQKTALSMELMKREFTPEENAEIEKITEKLFESYGKLFDNILDE